MVVAAQQPLLVRAWMMRTASCCISVIMSYRYTFTDNKYVMYGICKLQHKFQYMGPLEPKMLPALLVSQKLERYIECVF